VSEQLMPDLGCCALRPMTDAAAAHLAPRMAGMDPWRRLDYEAAALQHYLVTDSPGLSRYQIAVDGQCAGVVAVRSPWLRGPYLELLAVLPGHQGRGIGAAVLRWLEAQAEPARNLWVVVSAFNEGARRFYARHGFAEVGAVPGLVREGFDEILMRRVVGR
jgi:GNAT superfamily N-acetyltransferase